MSEGLVLKLLGLGLSEVEEILRKNQHLKCVQELLIEYKTIGKLAKNILLNGKKSKVINTFLMSTSNKNNIINVNPESQFPTHLNGDTILLHLIAVHKVIVDLIGKRDEYSYGPVKLDSNIMYIAVYSVPEELKCYTTDPYFIVIHNDEYKMETDLIRKNLTPDGIESRHSMSEVNMGIYVLRLTYIETIKHTQNGYSMYEICYDILLEYSMIEKEFISDVMKPVLEKHRHGYYEENHPEVIEAYHTVINGTKKFICGEVIRFYYTPTSFIDVYD